jgi:hypothetical protein
MSRPSDAGANVEALAATRLVLYRPIAESIRATVGLKNAVRGNLSGEYVSKSDWI